MPPLDDMPSLVSLGRPRSLGVHVAETVSTLREVVLMPRDLVPSVPRRLGYQADVVVLVHGIFASAGVWRPMRRALSDRAGAQVATFTHAPGVGIARIARSLAKLVERLPNDCRVHLVGHSLGGVVARWYVQELGGHARVAQTISLGSPFGGTTVAHLFPFLVGRELARTSSLLSRLRARAYEHDVPHTSIVAEGDAIIVPAESAVFPKGDVVVLPRCGHNTLLFRQDSVAQVLERVQLVQAKARRERLAEASEERCLRQA